MKSNKQSSSLTISSHEAAQKVSNKKSAAVRKLEGLANEQAQLLNPTTPAEWLAPRRYNDNSANGITRCVIDFLKFEGHQAERISNTGRLLDRRKTFTDVIGRTRTIGSQKWIKGAGTNGTADISGTIYGRSVKIEVKFGKDRQSDVQRRYQQSIEAAGGVYLIIRTFEEFYNWYNLKYSCHENN